MRSSLSNALSYFRKKASERQCGSLVLELSGIVKQLVIFKLFLYMYADLKSKAAGAYMPLVLII